MWNVLKLFIKWMYDRSGVWGEKEENHTGEQHTFSLDDCVQFHDLK